MSNVEDLKSRPMPDPKLAEFVVVGRRHHVSISLDDAASSVELSSASNSTRLRTEWPMANGCLGLNSQDQQ